MYGVMASGTAAKPENGTNTIDITITTAIGETATTTVTKKIAIKICPPPLQVYDTNGGFPTYRTKNALRHEVEKPGISVVTPPNGSFLRQRNATSRSSGEIFVAVSAKRKVSRASSGLGDGVLLSERAVKKLRWFRRKRDNAHLDRS